MKKIKNITTSDGITLKNIEISRGTTTLCILAGVRFSDVRQYIHLTYDCMNDNLIVHEWYYLSKEQINQLNGKPLEALREIAKNIQ